MDVNMTSGMMNGNETLHDNCSDTTTVSQLHYLTTTSKDIHLVLCPFVLALGLPGNAITIAVIFAQRSNMTSTAVYLLMLAVSDSLLLLSGAFLDWIENASGFIIRETNDIVCKLGYFLYVSSAQISSCILIAITIERIIGIAYPIQYKVLYTSSRATLSGLLIYVIIFLMNVHFLYGFGVTNDILEMYGTRCGPLESLEDYNNFYNEVWLVLNFAVLFLMPIIVLSVGNAYILVKIFRLGYFRNVSLVETIRQKRRKHLRNLTILVVCLNSVFLLCVTPISLILIYEKDIMKWADEARCIDPQDNAYKRGIVSMMYYCAILLSYFNPSLNFILYMLSGRDFRKSVIALLTCKPINMGNAF